MVHWRINRFAIQPILNQLTPTIDKLVDSQNFLCNRLNSNFLLPGSLATDALAQD